MQTINNFYVYFNHPSLCSKLQFEKMIAIYQLLSNKQLVPAQVVKQALVNLFETFSAKKLHKVAIVNYAVSISMINNILLGYYNNDYSKMFQYWKAFPNFDFLQYLNLFPDAICNIIKEFVSKCVANMHPVTDSVWVEICNIVIQCKQILVKLAQYVLSCDSFL